ncbi:MAG: nuclear transport factor 2 family protein [Methylococcaceae bacterium]|nr:nuclear transport factor 2 family protein [Methylococcaceae bacterium]
MAAYPRAELEEMVARWLQANRDAEREGNWPKYLGAMYTDDAEYRWNIGPNEEFVARNRKQIEEWALGVQMEGFEAWRYPYHRILIDEQQGEVIGLWTQVSPALREDGTPYQVEGIGGSWFRYGGNYKWEWQRDFFDLGNVKALFFELAADGKLDIAVQKKIGKLAKGQLLPGHERLRPAPSMWKKIKGVLAMVRIAVLG